MRERVRFIEDLARVASGAVGAATGVRDEVEQLVRQRFERVAADLDLVSREDFATVEAMAETARRENAVLKAHIADLEARLAKLEAAPPAASPAAKQKAAKQTGTKKATATKTAATKTATTKASGGTRSRRATQTKTTTASKTTSKTSDK